MKKLELHHLAPYLPYKLRMKYDNNFLSPSERLLDIENYNLLTGLAKPILRPLSDLTKEIEHNGEKVIPALLLVKEKEENGKWKDIAPTIDYNIKIVQKEFGKCLKVTKLNQWAIYMSLENPERIEHFLFKKLLEIHFDVFGLIEKGLAKDINTLEQ